MRIAILYASVHHKNTEKLVKAISEKYPDITLIDTTKALMISLVGYDLVGIASGIYYGNFHKSIYTFITKNLPERLKVFLMYTCGSDRPSYVESMKQFLAQKNASVVGVYSCKGFDTFGPFKLVGGLCKGHPTEQEIEEAVQFAEKTIEQNMTISI
ncbi:MAG: flavodoxin family protein [Spirochaetaceae bacterium]|nr:flavodoxin family protein [Spirochaetaceae bacterium]